MQAATQFTPEQLIVAGRRAEQQGQAHYAQQFYRYLADTFPTSTEAYEARDALYRLSQPAAEPHHPPAGPAKGAPVVASPPPPVTPPRAQPGMQGELRAVPLGEAAPQRDVRPARTSTARRKAARADADVADAEDVAEPPRGYRIGRIVAAMLNTIGWLLLISVVLAIPGIFAALTVRTVPKGLKDAIAGNVFLVGGGTFAVLLLGLFAIFAAQVARATFDTADATRALYDGAVRATPDV